MTRRANREEMQVWLRPYVDAQSFQPNGRYAAQVEAIFTRIMDDRKTVELPWGTVKVLGEMVAEKIGKRQTELGNHYWRVRLNKQKEFAINAAE